MFGNSASKERKNKSHFPRYRQIAMVLAKYRLEEVLKYVGIKNYALVGWMLRGNPFRKMAYTKPERTRMAIEELGTTFVKLGQILSTRADLLPPEYTQRVIEIAKCFKTASYCCNEKVISDDLGRPADEIFSQFTPEPVGVASIGQVYACTVKDGPEVVVKVQKPGVPEMVEEDMFILGGAAVSATKTLGRGAAIRPCRNRSGNRGHD